MIPALRLVFLVLGGLVVATGVYVARETGNFSLGWIDLAAGAVFVFAGTCWRTER